MNYRRAIYEKYASHSGLSQPLKSKYQSLARNVGPLLAAQRNRGTLLDIGSGQGELLTLCGTLGIDAEGVDLAREEVDSCVQRGLKVTLIEDLGRYLAEVDRRWDVVSMIDVIEHFTKSEAFELLQLVRGVLKPGGRVILQTPNMQNPFAPLNLFHDLTHEWAYTEASIEQLLLACGFQKIQTRPAEYPARGTYYLRTFLRGLMYLFVRLLLAVDQPNRRRVLTPNMIAVAEV
jgi:2-polyprenyl-3-methyl-5-hydroxy-6-metoxy-1,4-benzoquinol methylase